MGVVAHEGRACEEGSWVALIEESNSTLSENECALCDEKQMRMTEINKINENKQ
jgi:hypothetical protein